ncbi:MAG: HAD hydrolase-like protein [Zestosphaera sp.]
MGKRYRALILDIDDTMVRTGIEWSVVRNRLREILGFELPRYPIAEYLVRHGSELPKEKMTLVEEVVKGEELRSALSVESDPRLIHVLKKLKDAGYLIAVVTLRSKETAELVLDRLGCLQHVDLILTRDSHISRAEQLREAIKLLGVEAREVLFFGDHFTDHEAANELNIDYVLVPKRSDVKGVPQELLSFLNNLV